ncbi:MAG: tRNA pseudouridine(55) synthase TruB [Candidatus Kapaibacterium sp.]
MITQKKIVNDNTIYNSGELILPKIYSKDNIKSLIVDKLSLTEGIIIFDKGLEWTSFDVVAKVRNLLRIKKVGHTGTLDPLATGLLLICLGKATKIADRLQSEIKEYIGVITIGASSKTDDAEIEPTEFFSTEDITNLVIENVAFDFIGQTQQIPPIYSARKINGRKMYELAREGEQFIPESKQIEITEFEVTSITRKLKVFGVELEKSIIEVEFRIVCNKGTYIRSIARDFGMKCNSGGYLTKLRRTKSGNFDVKNGITIDDLISINNIEKEKLI